MIIFLLFSVLDCKSFYLKKLPLTFREKVFLFQITADSSFYVKTCRIIGFEASKSKLFKKPNKDENNYCLDTFSTI